MVRKFQCIRDYPGTSSGSIAEFDKENFKFVDTFHDKTYDFLDIVYNPEYWEELRTLNSILSEAKERYPIGYKIKRINYPEEIYTITENDRFFTCGNGNLVMLETKEGNIRLYENKKWLIW